VALSNSRSDVGFSSNCGARADIAGGRRRADSVE
jgi:hypothetical protein